MGNKKSLFSQRLDGAMLCWIDWIPCLTGKKEGGRAYQASKENSVSFSFLFKKWEVSFAFSSALFLFCITVVANAIGMWVRKRKSERAKEMEKRRQHKPHLYFSFFFFSHYCNAVSILRNIHRDRVAQLATSLPYFPHPCIKYHNTIVGPL